MRTGSVGHGLKKSLELVRSRIVLKALDALMTAPLRPRRSLFSDCRRMLDPRSPNYERTACLAGLADRIVPGFSARLSQTLIHPARLPLVTTQVELLSFGSGATVLLLNTPVGPRVLKIYRRSLGRSPESLLELAKAFRRKHEIISQWYNREFDLVLPTDFLVLHGPLLSSPAVAALQPYIPGTKKDLFRDFDPPELLELFRSDPQLGRQFAFFARQTIQLQTEHELLPDFLGKGNVAVVMEAGCRKLRVMDYGIFNLRLIRKQSPATASQLEDCFQRLKSVLECLPCC
jgi:hypothetical protein